MTHSDGQFKGQGDLNLYYQCWLPADNPKAIILIVHGLAEHSGRHSNIVNYLVPRGYGVYSFDLRGHGKSEGVRGYVKRFSLFVDDLEIFLRLVRNQHDNSKIFLMGHSVGATVATAYTILHQDQVDGVIITGISLSTPSDVAASTIFAARILSLILPMVGLYTIDAEAISQDKNVVNAYVNDPLVYRGKIHARLGVEIIRAMDAVKHQMSEIHIPMMVMHGAADRLSDPKDSELLYQKASSADMTLKVYQGYYHEIFNEPGREQVLFDIESWLNIHI